MAWWVIAKPILSGILRAGIMTTAHVTIGMGIGMAVGSNRSAFDPYTPNPLWQVHGGLGAGGAGPYFGSKLHGANQVIRTLQAMEARMHKGAMRGLIRGAMMILRDCDKTPPKIPVDTGNLRASQFAHPSWELGKDKPKVTLGYAAFYAWYVHENVGANFQRPGAGAKWLEASMNRNKAEVRRIIAEEVRKAMRR
jgi:hypothetical protein